MICQICNQEFTDAGFAYHIHFSHHLSDKRYYDRYIKVESEGICEKCGKEADFISLSNGYHKLCKSCKNQSQKIICRICGQETNALGMPSHCKKHGLTTKDYYDKFLKEGVCRICGKPTKFGTIMTGYNKTCSRACQYEYQKTAEYESIRISTIQQTYGVDYTGQIESAKEKRKQTTLDHYGVENPFQSDIVKEKCKQTYIEHYGTDHNMKSEKGKEEYKQGVKKKYGTDYITQAEEIQAKSKSTKLSNQILNNELEDADE